MAEAARRGVTALALTDHDTVAGLEEASWAAAGLGLRLVPGIEIGSHASQAREHPETDVLGYFVDATAAALATLIDALRVERARRAAAMVERLRALGADVTWEAVERVAGGAPVGRPHVARTLVQAGFVGDTAEAFRRYLGRRGAAYVARSAVSATDACRVVREAGGVPVLAHPVPPARPTSDPKRLRFFLPALVDAGLGGMECYYPGYSPRVSRWLVALAGYFGLVPTGGSDYHGRPDHGHELGSVPVPPDTLELLERALARP